MASIVVSAVADGSLRPPARPLPGPTVVTEMTLQVAGGLPSQLYADAVERALVLLVALVGALTYELFGHLAGAVHDPTAWFDRAMAVAAEGVGLVLPLRAP